MDCISPLPHNTRPAKRADIKRQLWFRLDEVGEAAIRRVGQNEIEVTSPYTYDVLNILSREQRLADVLPQPLRHIAPLLVKRPFHHLLINGSRRSGSGVPSLYQLIYELAGLTSPDMGS